MELADIHNIVCNYLNLEYKDDDNYKNKTKTYKYVLPRMYVVYFCREFEKNKSPKFKKFDYQTLADFYKKKSHASIINNYKKMKGFVEVDKDYQKKYNQILNLINNYMKGKTDKLGIPLTDGCYIVNNRGTRHEVTEQIFIKNDIMYWSDGEVITELELDNIRTQWVKI